MFCCCFDIKGVSGGEAGEEGVDEGGVRQETLLLFPFVPSVISLSFSLSVSLFLFLFLDLSVIP